MPLGLPEVVLAPTQIPNLSYFFIGVSLVCRLHGICTRARMLRSTDSLDGKVKLQKL